MLVIKLQKICKIIIPVLIPFEQKPVHNIRIPVALRNFCFAQQTVAVDAMTEEEEMAADAVMIADLQIIAACGSKRGGKCSEYSCRS